MTGNFIYPRHCPVCDEALRGNALICGECANVPRMVARPRCMKCGKHIETNDKLLCGDCKDQKRAFESGVALFEYDSVKDSVNAFKNEGRRDYAEYFGTRMAEELGGIIKGYSPDVLVPVPLHRMKERKRGYNQAELLAKVISKKLGIPVDSTMICRVKSGKEQKKLSDDERQNNLSGAFHMRQNDVKLSVVLVDDVYTTGSTVDEVARTLLAGGVERVHFVTLAIGSGD